MPTFQPMTLQPFINAGKLLGTAVFLKHGQRLAQSINSFEPGLAQRAVARTKRSMKVKRQRKTKKTKLATVATVKRMLSGVMEKKQFGMNPYVAALDRINLYTYNVTAQIAAGTADGQRIGDVIHLNRLEMKIKYKVPIQASYYRTRILVLWSGEEYNPSASSFSTSGLPTTEVFVTSTNTTEPINRIVNTKACTVLYDQTINLNSNVNAFPDGYSWDKNITLGQKFSYQAPGSVFGKTKNLYVVALGFYETGGTPAPADAGVLDVSLLVKYTDV